MANISITTKCNKKCRYCFASKDDLFMDSQTFEKALDFLDRSGIKELRMLGGEPTLHPQFSDFIKRALDRRFSIQIFSNAYMPETAISILEEIPVEKVKVLVNIVTDPENFNGLDTKQRSLFQRLGSKLIPGFSIDTPTAQLDFLLDIVLKYQTAREIRLGLAHPRMEGGNYFLSPNCYPLIGEKIIDFIERIEPYGIKILFDCGFVPCMFPEESFGVIGKQITEIGKRCNPILDILPGGQIVSCFPLTTFQQATITEDTDDKQLRAAFLKRQKPFRSMTLYKKCHSCKFRIHGYCVGGCLSASMQRQRSDSFSFSMPTLI